MIKSIGVDIVKLSRLEEMDIEKFADRILSELEKMEYLKINNQLRKLTFLGGRFAAKEALFKCFTEGSGKTNYKDFSILNKDNGSPYVLSEYTKEYITHITISHTNTEAIAFVVLEYK